MAVNYETYPPFFQLQQNQATQIKQLTRWENRILEFCTQKKICILDLKVVRQSSLFKAGDLQAEQQLINAIVKHMLSDNTAQFIDEKKESLVVYPTNICDTIYKLIKMETDIMTIDEVVEKLQVTQIKDIPKNILQNLLRQLSVNGKVSLSYDGRGLIDGVKPK